MKKKLIPLSMALALSAAFAANAAPGYQFRVAVPGVVAAGPAVPVPTATLTSLADFGTVTVGQSKTVSLTLFNTGATVPLQLNDITWSGANIARADTDTCPFEFPATLSPLSSCTITALWTPSAAGALTGAAIGVADNAPGTPASQALQGQAILPQASATFAGVTQSFGAVTAGVPKSLTFTLSNTSAYTPLQVSAAAVVGTGVTLAPGSSGTPCPMTFPHTVAVNGACTMNATWTPTATSTLTGASITVTDNAQGSPHSLSLTGTSTAPSDPHFANVVALLPFEGAGDVKGNTIGNTGYVNEVNPAQKRQGNSSGYFAGNVNQVLKIDQPALFNFAADFTIEGFVYPTGGGGAILNIGGISGAYWQSQSLWISGGNFIYNASSDNNLGPDIASNLNIGPAILNTWNHFALTRNGTVYRMFTNGKLTATININKKPFNPVYGLVMGGFPVSNWGNYPGTNPPFYLDELRITKNVARYTADYTVPALAFPKQ